MQDYLIRYTQWVCKRSCLILLTLPVLLIFLMGYIAFNLSINTDTRDMLSEKLPWRQLDIQYETQFPHAIDNLVIVIESKIPDLARIIAQSLHEDLLKKTDFIKNSFYIKEEEFISRSSLLYMQTDELQDYSDQLAKQQASLALLNKNPNLPGLFKLVERSIEHKQNKQIQALSEDIIKTLNARRNGEEHYISWLHLFSPNNNVNNTFREYIIVQPVMNFSSVFPAESAIHYIHQWQQQIATPVSVKLTGPVALAYDEFKSVSETNILAIIIAVTLLIIILLPGLGSWQMMLAVVITLLSGLVFTTAFATLSIGTLNLISVAFAVLYIGLGVDFAIHYCMSYQEHSAYKQTIPETLFITSSAIGKTLLFCAITTALGFFAFIPTNYVGIAELGWIAGNGMLISLVTTLTVLPALIHQFSIRKNAHHTSTIQHAISQYITTMHRPIVWFTLIGCIVSLRCISSIQFDYNTINLQSPNSESVQTYKELSNTSDNKPLFATVVVNGADQAQEVSHKLKQLETVKDVHWLVDFIPDNQEEKLFIIDDINLFLVDGLGNTGSSQSDYQDQLEAIESLSAAIQTSSSNEKSILGQSLLNYRNYLKSLAYDEQILELQTLERNLLLTLVPQLETLSLALTATEIKLTDLPPDFRKRWLNNEHYLIEIYPREDLSQNENLKRFVTTLKNVEPNVTGPAVILVEAGKAVVDAFKQAFIYAFLAISLWVFLFSYKKLDTLYIMIALILTALFTSSFTVIMNIPFNFANVIALPLLLGIGVDNSIHILRRHHTAHKSNILESSVARAIVLSSITTLLSIGNLAFSTHLGTASMGLLLTVGITISLLCSLVILPSFLSLKR